MEGDFLTLFDDLKKKFKTLCYSLSGRCIGTHPESISNCNSSIIGRISTIFLIVNHVPNRTLNPLCGNSNGLQDMCSYLPYLAMLFPLLLLLLQQPLFCTTSRIELSGPDTKRCTPPPPQSTLKS